MSTKIDDGCKASAIMYSVKDRVRMLSVYAVQTNKSEFITRFTKSKRFFGVFFRSVFESQFKSIHYSVQMFSSLNSHQQFISSRLMSSQFLTLFFNVQVPVWAPFSVTSQKKSEL